MKTYPRATGFARVIVLLLLMLSVAAAMASGSNKWRIKFNHSARSDGAIVLNISSKDEAPITVTTQVAKGTSEDHVAKLVRDSLRAQLGEHYHIEIDDGEVKFDYDVKPTRFGWVTIFCPPCFMKHVKKDKDMSGIPVEHARWFAGMVGKLSDEQIRQAFRAAGATDAEVSGFSARLRQKIEELKRAVQ